MTETLAPKPKKSRSMCIGCKDDFYNGNNQLGVKRCWNFKHAQVKRLKCVKLTDTPP